MNELPTPKISEEARRVIDVLDYLLTYPAGVPVLKKVYGYPLRPSDLRSLVGEANDVVVAIGDVAAFVNAFARTGETLVSTHAHMSLKFSDVVAVLDEARQRSYDKMCAGLETAEQCIARAREQTNRYVDTGGEAHEVITADRTLNAYRRAS